MQTSASPPRPGSRPSGRGAGHDDSRGARSAPSGARRVRARPRGGRQAVGSGRAQARTRATSPRADNRWLRTPKLRGPPARGGVLFTKAPLETQRSGEKEEPPRGGTARRPRARVRDPRDRLAGFAPRARRGIRHAGVRQVGRARFLRAAAPGRGAAGPSRPALGPSGRKRGSGSSPWLSRRFAGGAVAEEAAVGPRLRGEGGVLWRGEPREQRPR